MTREVHLQVEGMNCPDCASRVEAALRAVDGVASVDVALMAGTACVVVDAEKSDRDVLVASLRDAGYEVPEEDDHCCHHGGEGPWYRNPMRQRTVLSGVLFAIGLGGGFVGGRSLAGLPLSVFDLSLILAAAIGGLNFFPSGFRSLFRLSLDMDFLMTAAIFGAAAIGEYREAAAIAFLFSTAELLEGYAVDRARRSIETLMSLAPDTATVRRGGQEVRIDATHVVVCDEVIVRPGERVPVDGHVRTGTSAVDESPITGESMPVTKSSGDAVYSGTINREGYLELEASRLASESTLARIISLVQDAEKNRAGSEQFVQRFSRIYTPVVTVVALMVMTVPALVYGADFTSWFVRGLTLLVIACPCSLVISTPVAVVSAITSAARHGVLIKGGTYLEALGSVRAVAFDKTGTLTLGKPKVTDVLAMNGRTKEEVLSLAAALEQHSRHPVAEAIVSEAGSLSLADVTDFESVTGQGVQGTISGVRHRVGRSDLFNGESASLGEVSKGSVIVGTDEEVLGQIVVEDKVRDEASRTIVALKAAGVHVVMLTGDDEVTAARVAEVVGIEAFHARLMPEDKVRLVRELEDVHGPMAMVGDGVNDAPALAAATVGVAMGVAGSDTALETADVALMGDDLTKLPYLLRLSRASTRVIHQNVITSILIKVALAIGVIPGLVSLVTAVMVGDMGTSLGVTGNALRLAKRRP